MSPTLHVFAGVLAHIIVVLMSLLLILLSDPATVDSLIDISTSFLQLPGQLARKCEKGSTK